MTTTPAEAQRRYDALTKRIAALDADIASEVDSERRATLQERQDALVRERDAITSQPQGRATNGDLAELNRKAAELAGALTSDSPTEAHRIILDCVAALERLDNRITKIETHINPPWQVTFWRVMALVVFFFAGSLFWIKETREVLFGVVLWAGLATEGALLLLVVACLLLANAKLEHAK